MSIYPRKNKQGIIWYVDYYDEKGRRIRRAIGTKKQAEAVDSDIKLKQFEHRTGLISGSIKHIEKWSDYLPVYFDHAQKTLQKTTYRQDRSRIKVFENFIFENKIISLNDLNMAALQKFQRQFMENHSPKSWNNLLGLIKAILNRAVEWDLIEINPISRVKPMKIDKKFHYFKKDEIAAIIEASPPELARAIKILVYTGLRRSELWNLRWRDVDQNAEIIIIQGYQGVRTKGGNIRSIPISPFIKALLARPEAANSNDYVCRPYISIGRLNKKFHKALDSLGLTGTCHDLRHTFASYLAMTGTPIQAIAELLGHSDIKTTMIYSHLSPDIHKAAIGKIKFQVPDLWPKLIINEHKLTLADIPLIGKYL